MEDGAGEKGRSGDLGPIDAKRNPASIDAILRMIQLIQLMIQLGRGDGW